MISGWGRYLQTQGTIIEADDAETARTQIITHQSLIPRGNGRAYGDAALNHHAMLTHPRAVQPGMEGASVGSEPGFLGLIGAIHEHGLGIPIGRRAGQVIAALEQ